MYESLLHFGKIARQHSTILQDLGLQPKGYLLATVHRQSNTDHPENLRNILTAFTEIEEPVIFPVHPRTRQKIVELNLDNSQLKTRNPKYIEPVGYLDMLMLEQSARMILTDSGGIQKEAFWFGIPCITLREETEWVETVQTGWNKIAGANKDIIVNCARSKFDNLEVPSSI